jgi:L-aminopeptidase/D-esterase-like protein
MVNTVRAAVFAVAMSAAIACAAVQPAAPVPHVAYDGPSLSFDFPGVQIGVAEYPEGPTGTTVLLFPKPVVAAIDVRGGSPGTVNSDALRLVHEGAFLSAIVLSGGSAYGLSAATGVANALKDVTPNPGDWRNVAVVAGAIIFDLGDRRYNAVTPDDVLGRAALRSARPGWFPLGARGAGSFAMQGGYLGDRQHSGQGAALRQAGATKVLVITVVNAAGTIVDREGNVLRCSHPPDGKHCGAIAAQLDRHLAGAAAARTANMSVADGAPTANTTLTVVITNQSLPFSALQRLAVQVHNSMARAIQPFGMMVDGDTLFAVSTGEIVDPALNSLDLSTLASEAAWDAVIASAPPEEEQQAQAASSGKTSTEDVAGRYSLAPDVVAEIRQVGDAMQIEVTGRDSLYLSDGKPVGLAPYAANEFVLMTPRADHLRIDRDAHGRASGFTLNPGRWPIRARRIRGPV